MVSQMRILVISWLALCAGCSATAPVTIGPQATVALSMAPARPAPAFPPLDIDVRLLWPLRNSDFEILESTARGDMPDPITNDALRNAESHFLTRALVGRLQHSGHWGFVRLNPYGIAAGDIELSGKIIQSDGALLRLSIEARDARGRLWLARQYAQTLPRSTPAGVSASTFPFGDLLNAVANDLAAARASMLEGTGPEAFREAALLKLGVELDDAAFAPYSAAALPPAASLAVLRDLHARNTAFLDAMQLGLSTYIDSIRPAYLRFLAGNREVADFIDDYYEPVSPTRFDLTTPPRGVYSREFADAQRPNGPALPQLVLEFDGYTAAMNGSPEEQSAQWRSHLKQMYLRATTPP